MRLPNALLCYCFTTVYAYTRLSEADLTALHGLKDAKGNLDFTNANSLLFRILIPRAAGSQNLSDVQDMLVDRFNALHKKSKRGSWTHVEDVFTDTTPIGPVQFRNLVFTHNPHAEQKLVLAAHIDSKWAARAPDNQFIGATDSAAPCAMLVDIAEALTDWLDAKDDALDAQDAALANTGKQKTPRHTLSIVFFDGEEAFHTWTATDSIYGARHLAKIWSEPPSTPSAASPRPAHTISQISTLVLLDLLGNSNPFIRNYYQNTGWLYDEFIGAEDRLGQQGLLYDNQRGRTWSTAGFRPSPGQSPTRSFFEKRAAVATFGGHIEDDHLPFLAAGVPVVHLIPIPFPRVWHKLSDDATALDFATMQAWTKIVQAVTAEYLNLSPTHTATLLKRASDEGLHFARDSDCP